MTRPPVLSVEGLSLSIGGIGIVDDVSFEVGAGEVLALVGESGCGKSLTAAAVMRLLPDVVTRTRGTVRLGGQAISALPERAMRALRGRRMSMIFQEPQAALDPLSRIGRQIAEGLRLDWRKARPQVLRMLADVGISDPALRIDQYPFELSGGMCQRVMIASALIAGPDLLLADEPTTALDVTIQAQILDLLRRLARERGTAVVLITHDMGVVADIADRVAVMYAGRIAETGTVASVFSAPLHPYTRLLLASIPRLSDVPKSALAVIPGLVPTPDRYGPGCRFAGRCPMAMARCSEATPPLREIGPDRASACWRLEEMV